MPEQTAAEQTVVETGKSPQPSRLLPLQLALHAPVPAHAARDPVGAPLTAVQCPTLPPTLHASHWPLHAPSQQTPSTHSPVAQSLAIVQVCARSNEHVPFEGATLHFWPPEQLDDVQHTPSVQLSEAWQSPIAEQVAPALPRGTHCVVFVSQ